MSQPIHKAGDAGPFVTNISISRGDRRSVTFTVEGRHEDLQVLSDDDIYELFPREYTDYGIKEVRLDPADRGMGRLTVRASEYDPGSAATPAPVRTTFSVEMEAVQYDLEDHPYLSEVRDVIVKWLATDESTRVQDGSYYYTGKDGEEVAITHEKAKQFFEAYMAGIKTFNRYYPVVQKISVWNNPPGLTRSGSDFTGGSPAFSNCGSFNTPPISLSGYAATGFFKSKDSWQENANRTWSRTEEWTWTPDGSGGEHAWIYASSSSGGGTTGGNGGGTTGGGNN